MLTALSLAVGVVGCGSNSDDDDAGADDDSNVDDDTGSDDDAGDDDDDDDNNDDNDDDTPYAVVTVMDPPVGNPLAREISVVQNFDAAISAFVTTPGEPGVGLSTPQASEAGYRHSLWFFGLLEDTTYDYVVYRTDTEQVLETGQFSTPELKWWMPRPVNVVVAPEADPSDWISTVINSAQIDVEHVGGLRIVVIYDRQGRPRFLHEVPTPTIPSYKPLQAHRVFSNGKIVVSAVERLLEISRNGAEAEVFDLGVNEDLFRPAHHEFYIRDYDSDYAMVLYNEFGPGVECDLETPTESAIGDGVVILDRDGGETWRWSTFDHQDKIRPDMMNQAVCRSFHFGPGSYDWTHGNAVVPVPGQDAMIVSLRNVLQLVKVDTTTGDVLWQMGPEVDDFTWIDSNPVEDHWFRMQHGPTFLTPTRLLLFDNGNCRYDENCLSGPFSRAIEIEIDEEARTAELVWEHRVPFSHAMGSAERLENGNTLIYSGWQGEAYEVNADHETVWSAEFIALQKIFDLRHYPALWDYDATPPIETGK